MSLDGFEGGISFADLSFFSWRSLSAAVSATLLSMSFMFETGNLDGWVAMIRMNWLAEVALWFREWLSASSLEGEPTQTAIMCRVPVYDDTKDDTGWRTAHKLTMLLHSSTWSGYQVWSLWHFSKILSFFFYKERYSLHTVFAALKRYPKKERPYFFLLLKVRRLSARLFVHRLKRNPWVQQKILEIGRKSWSSKETFGGF